MIDIHCHILPAVDDGPEDLNAALAICHSAAADGCTAMVATPHLRHEFWHNGDREYLERLWRQVRDEMRDVIDIHLGGEIAVNSESFDELQQLPDGNLLPLAGSRYLLLEFHTRGFGPDPEELIHELTVGGWVPVLAHPERIPWLASDPRHLQALLDLGALAQVTALSVTHQGDRFGSRACSRMLEAGMVHFVASDAHDIHYRPPGLSQAYHLIAETLGEAKAKELFISNPQAVLENRPLSTPAASSSNPEKAPSGVHRRAAATLLSRFR